MKCVGGIWLPDQESHLVHWMLRDQHARYVNGRLTYQYHKLEAAMRWCRNFRVAVDVGAHVGLWSMHLVKSFRCVHAFEPVSEHRECFHANIPEFESLNLYNGLHACALGDREGMVSIHTAPTSSGDSWVDGDGDIPMVCLDSLCLQDVDFIKIDVEGYELQVVQGAVETIKRCRPCMVVEQKQKNLKAHFGVTGTPAVDLLRDLGAHLREMISGDYILSFDEAG